MTDSRGCEHEGTKVETASNRLNGVADPEGATAVGTPHTAPHGTADEQGVPEGYGENGATDTGILEEPGA